MSSRLPRVTGEEAVRAFCKAGYIVARTSGSHFFLKFPDGRRVSLSIPVHKEKTLGIELPASKIKDAGLTPEEFCNLL